MIDRDLIQDVAERLDSDHMTVDEMAATIRLLCREIIRLREAEKFNAPILRSAMMHMPIG